MDYSKLPDNVELVVKEKIQELFIDDVSEGTVDVPIYASQQAFFEGLYTDFRGELTVQFDLLRCGANYIITSTDEMGSEHTFKIEEDARS